MPNSILTKEMHEYLGVSEWKAETSQVIAPSEKVNVWQKLSRVARVLGISEEPDRTIRSIRQKAVIKRGDPIPFGYNYGQWGRNTGEQYQKGDGTNPALGERDGMVYENKSNQILADGSIVAGDFVLVENWSQFLDAYFDDLDKGLNWQEAGAGRMRSPTGDMVTWEGLGSLLAHVEFTTLGVANNLLEVEVSSLVTQAMCIELIRAIGQPTETKYVDVQVGASEGRQLPYLGLSDVGKTITGLFNQVFINLAVLVGKAIKPVGSGGIGSTPPVVPTPAPPDTSVPVTPQSGNRPPIPARPFRRNPNLPPSTVLPPGSKHIPAPTDQGNPLFRQFRRVVNKLKFLNTKYADGSPVLDPDGNPIPPANDPTNTQG